MKTRVVAALLSLRAQLNTQKRIPLLLVGFLLIASQASAQEKTVTGKVTNDQGAPLSGVSVVLKGTGRGALTNTTGSYSIRATSGQVLQFSYIGTSAVERTVGAENTIDVQLRNQAISLDALEVVSMGQT